MLGVLLGFDWVLAVAWVALWLIIAKLFRYSSLAALMATVITLILSYLTSSHWFDYLDNNIYIVIAFSIISVLVFWRHRENIKNLLAGTESRIGKK